MKTTTFLHRALIFTLFILGSSLFSVCNAQLTATPSPNDIQVTPNTYDASEVSISIDKSNPNILLLSANADAGASAFVSTSSSDAGLTWSLERKTALNFFGTNHECYGDPSTAIDANGNMYIATGDIYGSHSCLNCFLGNADTYYLAVSTNHGSSFTVNKTPNINASDFDKDMITTDDVASSPYSGNVYCAYCDVGLNNLYCETYKGGLTSPNPVPLWDYNANGQGGGSGNLYHYRCWGTDIQTDANGNVYVCWAVYDDKSATKNALGLGFAYSSDGGNTFTNLTNYSTPYVFPYNGYDGTTLSNINGVRTNCFPSMAVDKSCYKNGRIYVTFSDEVTVLSKTYVVIQLNYSDDGGNTWLANPVTVSDVSSSDYAVFPWITVDDVTGIVYVDYYEYDVKTGSTDTYLACSADGGNTFTQTKISQASHVMAPISSYIVGDYAGDYIGIAAYNNKVYPAWMDNRGPTTYWNVWVNPVTISWQISTNTTWSIDMYMPADVEVKPGNTLTISKGVTIRMAQNRKILVDPGAKLIVNGTITRACNTVMWDGIEVLGNASQPQSNTGPSGQGYVQLNTGSSIEYAYNGITTGKSIPSGWDLSTTGGIIIATKATFKNCQRAVQYLYYTYPNRGVFNGCTFSVDNMYPGYPTFLTYPLQPAVSMWGVRSVQFFGNTFENKTPLVSNVNLRGSGISSVDADYSVTNCNVINVFTGQCGGKPNTFTGYEYGIYAANSNPVNTIEIIGNQFTDNYADIDMQGVDYEIINQNTFEKNNVVGYVPFCLNCHPYNIYLDQCTGYSVQENTFTVGASGPTDAYGIIFNNNGTDDNLLYNNSFNGLYVGSQSQGTNGAVYIYSKYFGFSGLQMKCNQYNSSVANGADIAVTSGLMDGIQGVCTDPTTTANNTFNNDCPSRLNIDVANYVTWGVDYSCANIAGSIPYCVSPTGVVVNPCTGVSSMSCGHSVIVINSNIGVMSAARDEYEHKVDSLNNYLVAGNAPSLYTAINSDPPGVVKSTLLAAGPYLSDSVLIAALNAGLPPGILKDILMTNSPFDSTVLAVFNKVSLPKGVKSDILSAQTGISPRTELENEISYYHSLDNIVLDALIRYYLNDTLTSGIDSAEMLIQTARPAPTCSQMAQLGFMQLANGEDSAANSTLTAVKAMGDPTYDDYCQLLPVLIQLQKNPLNTLGLQASDSGLVSTVNTIAADSTTMGSVNAKALLEYVFNRQFVQPIEPLPLINNMRRRSTTTTTGDTSYSSQFVLYPNPANNKLYIKYPLVQRNIEDAKIMIYNTIGNNVGNWTLPSFGSKAEEDISNLPVGFYIYSIIVGNNIVQRGKFIIER